VRERTAVAREDREELHRQNGGRADERFDDRFVRDRGAGDPFEVGEAARDGRFSVLPERRVRNRQVQSGLDVKQPNGAKGR
jgi:hypothetical protein